MVLQHRGYKSRAPDSTARGCGCPSCTAAAAAAASPLPPGRGMKMPEAASRHLQSRAMSHWLLPAVAGTSWSVLRPALHAALVHGMQSALLALLLVRSNTC